MAVFFKKHRQIFILAFTIGLLVVAPTLSAILQVGSDFKGIYPMFSNDEDQYLAMTREVYDWHYNFGSVYLKEHKESPDLQQPLAEIIFAEMAKIFNISIPTIFAINDFLLPFVGVIALYFLLFGITKSAAVSSIFSSGYYMLFLYWFNRPINPQFSFIFLFLGLLVIWKIIENTEKSLKQYAGWNMLLTVIFGATFYIYPFVWSSILVVYCLMLFLLVITERRVGHYVKNFLCFAVPASVFSIPYVISLQKAALDPNYRDANLRFGFIFNHWPGAYFNVLLMLVCLIVLFLATKKITERRVLFGYSAAFAGIALNWQNVITGKAFSFSMHYYWVIALFIFLIFSICVSILRDNYKNSLLNYRGIFAIFLMLAMLSGLAYKERDSMRFGLVGFMNPLNIEELKDQQRLADVADWFDKNSIHDSAILSLGKNYHGFIPTYTYNNDFQNANSGLFLISDDELENRWVIQNFFSPNIDREYVEKHSVEIWANKFIEQYQSQANRNKIISFFIGTKQAEAEFIPQEYINRVLAKVNFYKTLGFGKSLKQYSVDYILLDTNDAEYGYLAETLKQMPFLALVASIENHLIFKVVK